MSKFVLISKIEKIEKNNNFIKNKRREIHSAGYPCISGCNGPVLHCTISQSGLQAWYCHSQVMLNVQLRSVLCFQWSNSWKAHLTEIWCGKYCHVTHRSHNNTVWQIGLISFSFFISKYSQTSLLKEPNT